MQANSKLEQDGIIQTNDNRVAELQASLHQMSRKYKEERAMFNEYRKSKNTQMSDLKEQHNNETAKTKKENDTVYLNQEKENQILKSFQYTVQGVHLEALQTRDRTIRDKENKLRSAKLQLRGKNKQLRAENLRVTMVLESRANEVRVKEDQLRAEKLKVNKLQREVSTLGSQMRSQTKTADSTLKMAVRETIAWTVAETFAGAKQMCDDRIEGVQQELNISEIKRQRIDKDLANEKSQTEGHMITTQKKTYMLQSYC